MASCSSSGTTAAGAPGDYPDFGCSFETFTNADFLELETLGPLATLAPGESLTHTERWTAFRGVQIERWDDDELDRVLGPLSGNLSCVRNGQWTAVAAAHTDGRAVERAGWGQWALGQRRPPDGRGCRAFGVSRRPPAAARASIPFDGNYGAVCPARWRRLRLHWDPAVHANSGVIWIRDGTRESRLD